MPSLSRVALSALLSATMTAGQTLFAEVFIYETEKCADDPFGTSLGLKIFEESLVTAGPDGGFQGSCTYANLELGGDFPVDSSGNYLAHVDAASVPEGCEMIFFRGAPIDDAVSQGECWAFNSLTESGTSCSTVALPKKFGFS